MAQLGATPSTEIITPTGAILPYAAITAPTGWLVCDGAVVSRVTYAALFAVIGTTYGAGDGSTTFGLPDLRGRGIIGLGTHVDVDALGENDGLGVASRTPKHTHAHTFTLPNHTHTHSLTLPNHAHSHTLTLPNHSHSAGGLLMSNHIHGVEIAVGDHQHTIIAATSSSLGAPDSFGVNFGSSFAATVSGHYHTLNASTSFAGAHTVTGNTYNGGGASAVTGSTGNPISLPSISGSVGNPTSNPTISGTVDNPSSNPSITGAITANNEPYIVMQYIIKAS